MAWSRDWTTLFQMVYQHMDAGVSNRRSSRTGTIPRDGSPRECNVNRKLLTRFVLAGLAALSVVLFLVWCPPDLCRVLNIQTHTISRLEEYRQFLADEAAFKALHHVRAVRFDCPALREDVVEALETGRLTLGASESNGTRSSNVPAGPVKAWQQGRLLHLMNGTSEDQQGPDAWAVRVRNIVAEQQRQELSFLPRLFGGVILHVHHKELPITLFSRNPCI